MGRKSDTCLDTRLPPVARIVPVNGTIVVVVFTGGVGDGSPAFLNNVNAFTASHIVSTLARKLASSSIREMNLSMGSTVSQDTERLQELRGWRQAVPLYASTSSSILLNAIWI
jgi:hypothetical protein